MFHSLEGQTETLWQLTSTGRQIIVLICGVCHDLELLKKINHIRNLKRERNIFDSQVFKKKQKSI